MLFYRKLTGITLHGGGDIGKAVEQTSMLPWWRSKTLFLENGDYFVSTNTVVPKNVTIWVSNGGALGQGQLFKQPGDGSSQEWWGDPSS